MVGQPGVTLADEPAPGVYPAHTSCRTKKHGRKRGGWLVPLPWRAVGTGLAPRTTSGVLPHALSQNVTKRSQTTIDTGLAAWDTPVQVVRP